MARKNDRGDRRYIDRRAFVRSKSEPRVPRAMVNGYVEEELEVGEEPAGADARFYVLIANYLFTYLTAGQGHWVHNTDNAPGGVYGMSHSGNKAEDSYLLGLAQYVQHKEDGAFDAGWAQKIGNRLNVVCPGVGDHTGLRDGSTLTGERYDADNNTFTTYAGLYTNTLGPGVPFDQLDPLAIDQKLDTDEYWCYMRHRANPAIGSDSDSPGTTTTYELWKWVVGDTFTHEVDLTVGRIAGAHSAVSIAGEVWLFSPKEYQRYNGTALTPKLVWTLTAHDCGRVTPDAERLHMAAIGGNAGSLGREVAIYDSQRDTWVKSQSAPSNMSAAPVAAVGLVLILKLDPIGDVTYTDGDEDVSIQPFANKQGVAWSATGLPAWLSIDTDTGEITGDVPADASDDSPFSITVTGDDGRTTDDASFDITVDAAGGGDLAFTVPADRTDSEGDAISGVSASATGGVTPYFFSDAGIPGTGGGPPFFDPLDPSLPPGLSIDDSTGEITGTISATANDDSPYTVYLAVDDDNGDFVEDSFVWTVDAS